MTTPETRREKFDANIPVLTEKEIDDTFGAGRMAISFRADPIILEGTEIAFIALKLALANGKSETVLLDQFTARVLHRLIETANGLEWKADTLERPAGST